MAPNDYFFPSSAFPQFINFLSQLAASFKKTNVSLSVKLKATTLIRPRWTKNYIV